MGKFTKGGVALFAGTVALAAFAGFAQAETRFAVQNAAGTVDQMVVTDSGTIGVGVTTPGAGLHVKGSAYPNNAIRAEGNEVTQGAGYLGYIVRTDGKLPQANDRLGFFLFGTLSGVNPLHASGVSSAAEATWTAGSTPAYFSFATTGIGESSRTERMRISGSGNVGIGTTAPGQKLEVAGGVRLNTAAVHAVACDATNRGTIWLSQTASGDSLDICMKIDSSNFAWQKIK